jgi:hypothetical protein
VRENYSIYFFILYRKKIRRRKSEKERLGGLLSCDEATIKVVRERERERDWVWEKGRREKKLTRRLRLRERERESFPQN